MAKRTRKARSADLLVGYREKSGWWLAAWRDFKGMTLEELADEVGTSKGVVSDLETGALRSNGKPAQRYNSDDVPRFAKALGIPQGYLFDVNPYAVDTEATDLSHEVLNLSKREQALLRQYMDTLTGKTGTGG